MDKKILALSAYLFWFPAIYLVLTEKRRDDFLVFHSRQALKLWVVFFLLFFGLRFLVNLVWSVYYLPGVEWLENILGWAMVFYVAYCGWRASRGEMFSIWHRND